MLILSDQVLHEYVTFIFKRKQENNRNKCMLVDYTAGIQQHRIGYSELVTVMCERYTHEQLFEVYFSYPRKFEMIYASITRCLHVEGIILNSILTKSVHKLFSK